MPIAKRQRRDPPEPGTFRPALPNGADEVVRLFAIAGRAVCARPAGIEEITSVLSVILRQLGPKERVAAEECARLWALFGRMAVRAGGKAALLEEGARALYRDLDSVGQRLDLPPLDPWTSLPAALHAQQPVVGAVPVETTDTGESLDAVRARAKALVEGKGKGKGKAKALTAEQVLELVSSLSAPSREAMFKTMIGQGLLGRAEMVLIEQMLKPGGTLTGELAVEGLQTVGAWLVQ